MIVIRLMINRFKKSDVRISLIMITPFSQRTKILNYLIVKVPLMFVNGIAYIYIYNTSIILNSNIV